MKTVLVKKKKVNTHHPRIILVFLIKRMLYDTRRMFRANGNIVNTFTITRRHTDSLFMHKYAQIPLKKELILLHNPETCMRRQTYIRTGLIT